MDRIAVGVCSDRDSERVVSLLAELNLEQPTNNFVTDVETRDGLQKFCSAKAIKQLHFLVKSRSDQSSNRLTREINDDLCEDRHSRIDLLAQKIGEGNCESDIWLIFAFSWNATDEVSYYSGSPDILHEYMRLNGGAYRLTYIIDHNQYNIDLDTPMIWKITN